MKYTFKTWHAVVALFVLLIVAGQIFSFIDAKKNPTPKSARLPSYRTCERWDAVYYSHKEIEMNLKSPKTAEFQSNNDAYFVWEEADSNKALVRSYVDSQNGFGALIRTHFVCELVCENGNWKSISCVTAQN
jgi:hypothetical protein